MSHPSKEGRYSPRFLMTGAPAVTDRKATEVLLERGYPVRAFVYQEGEASAS